MNFGFCFFWVQRHERKRELIDQTQSFTMKRGSQEYFFCIRSRRRMCKRTVSEVVEIEEAPQQ